MAYLDPNEAFANYRDRVLEGIKLQFPIKGKTQSLHLDDLEVKDVADPSDISAQHAAKINGGNFSAPVFASFRLVDNATGKTVDHRRIRVAEIPRMTQRFSYIFEGQEYQIDNQWQLKPGAYTRRRQNGELETRFNTPTRVPFDLVLDPATQQLHMDYKSSHLPLYPMMKALGVGDDQIERELGKETFAALKTARGNETALQRFYKSDRKALPKTEDDARAHFLSAMAASAMRPDATSITLGKPIDTVTGEALLLAAKKMLKVQNGHPEDDRDSLVFKDLRAAGDFVYDKYRAATKAVALKASRKINTAKDVRDVVKFDLLNEPVRQSFHKNSAARVATQINPVEMIGSSMQTTIMGPGGIQSEQQIVDEAKFINPSHLGFIDPINTPEGPKTGVTLRLPLGLQRIGREPHIPLYNLKTHKTELVSPATFLSSNVVLPDQVDWKNGKPVPLSKTVKLAGAGNDIKEGSFDQAHYVMRHSSQLFNMTSNLVPFLGNNSGNRASMATRHIEQAISLVHRSEPLVQVGTGVDGAHISSFEKVIGEQAAHTSPAAGVIEHVKPGSITVKGTDGTKHTVQLYNNFPLNDAKSVLHSTPLVKPGDKVRAGQVIADTNYSKNGTLALGTDLRTAYLPMKGYNFEDGVVISESASQKLSSQHLYKHKLPLSEDTVLSKHKFEVQQPGLFARTQLQHIGDDGIAKIGARVKPGDPLVLAMRPFALKDRTSFSAYRKTLLGTHVDKSLRWDGSTEGEVVNVVHAKDGVQVHVRTVEPMQVGDKLSSRHGAKGIVTMILPDHEMPHTKDGKHIEVALNPSGIPGRMNVGQVLETAASKIAEKTGKPYIAPSFGKGVDVVAKVMDELKQHGLSDTEEVIDPVTKQSLGQVMVGKQHILKLVHQVDKKVAVSPGMSLPGTPPSDKYDINLQPASGQRIGSLGMYAMLAHGAKANLREMQTWKGEGPDPQTNEAKKWPSQHMAVWAAIQTGGALPTPKPTFAFKKFEDMLRGSGVNIEKNGHEFMLSPLTDKHILELTGSRVLPRPAERVEAKIDKGTGEFKPRTGGMFDEKLTGGHGGTKWSRIDLAEPLPNPVFEKPICALLGLQKKDFEAIMSSEKGVSSSGQLGPLGKGMLTGGNAIKTMLEKLDVPSELTKAKAQLAKAKPADLDKMMKKVKYLQALHNLDMKPHEAYVVHHLPVIPPALRPVSVMGDGNLQYADVNELYKNFALSNEKLADKRLAVDPREQANLRKSLYDGFRAISGYGVPYANAEYKGLLHQIAGPNPKQGFFQRMVVQKRQDLTMRSTIVPEPALGIDEVGLPKEHALDLFRPFLVKKLVDMGAAKTPLDAQKVLAAKEPICDKALEKVMEERPVLMKRDPALHKYSVQAFQPKVVAGNAIKIHPLVCGGFNADFDGDTMSVFVPISREAVMEAHKMKPSQNVFMDSTGKVAYQPTLESALGLYKLSVTGKEVGKKFTNPGDVLEAVRNKSLGHTDIVTLNGKKTTPGRVLLASALPEAMQHSILHDLDTRIDKKGLDALLTKLGKDHNADFGKVVNKLKDIGNTTSYGSAVVPIPGNDIVGVFDPKKQVTLPIGAHTLSLKDFHADTTVRNSVLKEADAEVNRIKLMSLNPNERDRRIVETYSKADKKMRELHEKKLEQNPTNLFTMYKAGVKPGWEQYKQMVIAPMLLKDSSDRTLTTPVTRSYSEGLDVAGYWTQMHGARRGSVMKVQEVQEPGYLSKLLTNTMMDMIVTQPDCGTHKGVLLGVHEKDIHDRVLATDFKSSGLHVQAGTVLTPDIVTRIRAADKDARVLVRSPLKCEDHKGVCQHCLGLNANGHFHDIGTNAGVIAAQTTGERAVQLTLKSFHTGGVVEQGAGKLLNSFARLEQLTLLPKQIPNSASLAMASGTVDKIESTATGVNVFIGGKKHFVPKDTAGNALHKPIPGSSSKWEGISVGMKVDAGQHLSDPSRTYVNPHDLYKATKSIDKVQHHLTNEIYDLYKDEGVRRRHVEALVKGMTSVTKVVDPGDSEGILRGEFQPLAVVHRTNAELLKSGRKPIEHAPVLKGINVLPLDMHEDWMAKLQHPRTLRDTIASAAATAGKSNIHNTHPIPGLAYGAEFGLNSKQSKQPGYGHLADVAEHKY